MFRNIIIINTRSLLRLISCKWKAVYQIWVHFVATFENYLLFTYVHKHTYYYVCLTESDVVNVNI